MSEIPSLKFRPYTLGCYAGCPIGHKSCISSGERGFTADYLPVAANAPKSIFQGLEIFNNSILPSVDDPIPTISPTTTPPTIIPQIHREMIHQRSTPYFKNSSVIYRLPELMGGGLGIYNSQLDGHLEELPNGVGDSYILGLAFDDHSKYFNR